MADGEEKSALIKVTVKTPKEKQEIEISADAGVKEVGFISKLLYFWDHWGSAL